MWIYLSMHNCKQHLSGLYWSVKQKQTVKGLPPCWSYSPHLKVTFGSVQAASAAKTDIETQERTRNSFHPNKTMGVLAGK